MPAAIFNSDAVKILKNLLRFKNGKELITDKTNAQVSSGVVAPVGSMILTTEGRLYVKDGASDTDWNLTPFSLGVSGGQTITGGVDSGDDLTLESTSDATKGTINANSPINFNTSMSTPTYAAGNVSWNSIERTLDIQTGLGNTTLQVGQEVYVYVYNGTGSQLDNGSPVYISGVNGGIPTVALAKASIQEQANPLGLLTMDIPNGQYGFVTKLGTVRDIDTSLLSTGSVYLSNTDGVLSSSKPIDGSFVCYIGEVLVSDASVGSIFVNPSSSDLTVEVTDTNGFPDDQRTNTTLSFDDGTRTFTIAPTGSEFHFYEVGLKYEKTSAQTVVIDNTEGMHSIYFDGGTLTAIANASSGQFEDIVLNHAFVALLYWDAANSSGIYLGDERHGISMSPRTHAYLHLTRGAQYVSGLAIADILAGESGSLASHAQFSVGSGVIFDEDIAHLPPAVASTVGLDIYALEGATPNLRKYTETGFSVLTDTTAGTGATGRLVFNEFTGGSWQLTTVSNSDYVLCHVFAINGISGGQQWAAIIGQNVYTSLTRAKEGAETEISNILSILPLPEIVAVGTVLFQTRDSYTNSIKARIVSNIDGDDYTDWRTSDIPVGAPSQSHNNLGGLELASTGVTYGHIDDQSQSIYGVKNFITGFNLNTTTQVTSILDEDTMVSNSATALATQQSIKAYADSIAASSTMYVNQPSITAPTNGATGIDFSSNITTSAFSVANGGSDTHESSAWEISEQGGTVIYSNYEDTTNKVSLNISSADFTASKTYKIRVRHVGSTYGESQWSDYVYFTTATTLNHVDTPSITNPTEGEVNFEPMGDAITSSAYSHTGDATHVHSDWEMLNAGTKVVDASSYDDTTGKVSKNFDNSLLTANTNYLIRVRHNGSGTGDSLWSDYINAKTPSAFPSVDTPTITFPADDATGIDFLTAFTTSAFNLSNENDTAASHEGTDWQISTNDTFTALVKNIVNDTTNKTSYSFDSNDFSVSTEYFMRVRHKDANYGYSSYSATTSFTTASAFALPGLAHYDFTDGNVTNDSSVNSYTLTNTDGLTSNASGVIMSYSGDITDGAGLTEGTTLLDSVSSGFDLAIETYFKITTMPSVEATIFRKTNVFTTDDVLLRITSAGVGQVRYFGTGSPSSAITHNMTELTFTTGVWYHFVYLWSRTQGAVYYINNTQKVVDDTKTTLMSNGTYAPFSIGSNGSGSYSLNGQIAYTRVYNDDLSSGEVSTLYANR